METGLTFNRVPQVNLAGRQRIIDLEKVVAQLPQHKFVLKHHFVDGMYVREMHIPAGCILVGYIHMFPCITTVSQGRIAIYDGEKKAVILSASHIMCCQPGSKKAGYALTDTIWSDAYLNPDNEIDIDKLEKRLIAETHAEFVGRTEERLRLKGVMQ